MTESRSADVTSLREDLRECTETLTWLTHEIENLIDEKHRLAHEIYLLEGVQ